MNFNETNYRRLRAYLLTREGKFDWITSYQKTESHSACVACACLRLEGNLHSHESVSSDDTDIHRFLGCDMFEATHLYAGWNRTRSPYDALAAVEALDEVASHYGVTPESSAPQVQNESADEADRRPTLCQASDSATRPDASRSDSPTDREAAFLAQVRAEARETVRG